MDPSERKAVTSSILPLRVIAATLGGRRAIGEQATWRIASLLGAAILVVIFVLPMVRLFEVSFRGGDSGWTLSNYLDAFTNPLYLTPILNSLRVAATVVIICVAIGVPMAWLISRTDLPGRAILRVLVYTSFLVPPFLAAAAWSLLASPQTGLLNRALDATIGIKPFDIYSLNSLAVVMALGLFPYTVIFVVSSLDNVSGEIEEAAAILGAGVVRRTRAVILPLVAPAILAAMVLTFLQSLALFGAPVIIAVPAGEHVITTQMFLFFRFPPQVGLAAAYGMPLVFLAIGAYVIQRRILGRRRFTTIGGQGSRDYVVRLGRWRWVFAVVFWVIWLIATALPVGTLIYMAFAESWFRPDLGFTTGNFEWVFDRALLPIANTVTFAAAAATACIVLALLVAYLNDRHQSRLNRLLEVAAGAPVVLPGMVLAIGLYAAYSSEPLRITGTAMIVVLVYTVRFLPIALQNVSPGMRALDASLEEAARSVGARPLRTLRAITVPILGPTLLSAWILTFALSAGELSAVVLLVSIDTSVMSTIAVSLFNEAQYGRLSALGLLQIAIPLGLVLIGQLVVRSGQRKREKTSG